MSQWIKCSERMPDKFLEVLVVVRNPIEVLLAYLDNSNEFVFDRDSEGEKMICHATHWMPLPAPPED